MTKDLYESFLALVCVILDEPLHGDTGERARGYFITLGVRCANADLKLMLQDEILDGAISWTDSEWRRVNPDEIDDEDIRAHINHSNAERIWYRSGRIFFP